MTLDSSHLWTGFIAMATGGGLTPLVQMTLKKFWPKKEKSKSYIEIKVEEHEEKLNKIPDLIQRSEEHTITAFEGFAGRVEGQIKEANKRTDDRFSTMEKTHQDLLFRYMDLKDKKAV